MNEREKLAVELVKKSVHSLRMRAKVCLSLNGRIIEGIKSLEYFICFVIINMMFIVISKS